MQACPRLTVRAGCGSLTVCGVTRLGYGHAAPKSYGDPGMREKEVIGDALRNAAMRFGAALDLCTRATCTFDDEGDAGDKAMVRSQPPANPKHTTSARSRKGHHGNESNGPCALA